MKDTYELLLDIKTDIARIDANQKSLIEKLERVDRHVVGNGRKGLTDLFLNQEKRIIKLEDHKKAMVWGLSTISAAVVGIMVNAFKKIL